MSDQHEIEMLRFSCILRESKEGRVKMTPLEFQRSSSVDSNNNTKMMPFKNLEGVSRGVIEETLI